ncbi:MAG: 7-cyano-7-deazaguanine synthase QueC [Chitinivibrionales bacterium]|nr:7-cyano-7-deazaguanine synthase QueC [Chitinivibrionales bacterium]
MSPQPAIILLSGGLDSATCAAIAREQGFTLYAMSFRYGQRHSIELAAATRVGEYFKAAEHRIVEIDLRAFAGSSLTSELQVPKNRTDAEVAGGIPNTYVPARNTIFLSFALGWAEVLNCRNIFIGVNAVDYSGYPDCRPAFINAFAQMANLATKAGVEGNHIEIHTPLLHLRKAEIIDKGARLNLDFSLTHSCYDPSPEGLACGSCDSCTLRRKGFTEAGIPDPIRYCNA